MPENQPARGAVFLSYASQDAEAARRICEALRAAGVEVWFDTDGGLEHGDEWDAKIRRQIKECVLFLPLISANTQAREEGYFRLEWDLAAERARTIASGVAFILPVVIDDTKEPAALVPDRFRAVQWTRLKGGEVPPEVLQRFLKLWSHRTGVLKHQATGASSSIGDPPVAPVTTTPTVRAVWRNYAGLAAAIIGVVAGGTWWLLRDAGSASAPAPNAPPNARALLDEAWAQLNQPELARGELTIADGLCRQATDLEPNLADAWAAWSQVDSWLIYHQYDNTRERRESARAKMQRALHLAPESFEARLAQACYLVRGQGDTGVSLLASEAGRQLEALSRERPDEPRALLASGILQRNLGKAAEAQATFERLARQPAWAALATNEQGWASMGNLLPRQMEKAADRSLAIRPFWANRALKAIVLQYWHGDLAGAQTVLDRNSAAEKEEDFGFSVAIELAYWRRDPGAFLQLARSMPREWLRSNAFDGPTGWWTGHAEQLAGHPEVARLEWQAALRLVETRLAEAPSSSQLIGWKGILLAVLGQREEAAKWLNLAEQMGASGRWLKLDYARALIGERDAVIARVESWGRIWSAQLRLEPWFDPLRTHPRFAALQAKMDADPECNPAAAATAADKSVAVLAFANLSDDKGNEYFSDGISEELLNVLAKIPGLKVSARTSAFHFKGKDTPIPEIAQQLGVAYVVEGSVRKQGEKVRITAQLIKAADGFHVWSDTFTRDLKDIFAVQDEIAGLIAQQLQLKLGESTRVTKVVNPEAYRLLLEGRQFWNLRNEEGFTKAEAAFTKALAIDPQFAEAHVGLGGVCVIRAIYRELDAVPLEANDLARAVSEGRRALEIDPSSADALAVLGYAQMMGNQLAESDRNFQQALTLNPNSALVHCWYALFLSTQGRLDASLGHYQKAAEVDPLWFINLQMMGQSLGFAQQYDQALGVLERASALRTDVFLPAMAERARALQALGRNEEAFAFARQILHNPDQRPRWGSDARAIEVLLAGGRRQEAEAEAARLLTRYPPESYLRGFILAALGRFDEALPFLQRTQATIVRQIYWDTMWDPWRNDPRFLQLMAQLDRAEEYQVARETLARMLKEQAAK